VVFDSLCPKPAPFDARGGRTDLVLRLQANALCITIAMIDALIDIELGKRLVDMAFPAFAPLLDHIGAVPVADLGAEAICINLAHRQHDVRVRLGQAIGADVPVHIEIGDHALIHEFAFDKLARQANAFFPVELARDRKLDLARQLRALALLGCLDRVPQLRAVGEVLGAPSRSNTSD
jgi:hypothetical protein